jgi:hypothetical protein
LHKCGLARAAKAEQFLSPALERKLASYSRDELSSAGYVIIERKLALDAG